MKEQTEGVFTIAAENPPVPGCTVSALVRSVDAYDVYHFSLAARTNISAESYQYPKLMVVDGGTMELFTAADTVA
ncbi:MAG: cupin, partial [Oscillibacter sp.]|nr:cupin [Oscillibacter sp.]